MGVMSRLNLTLDSDTSLRLDRHAKREGIRRASVARSLIREALLARETQARRRKLAQDYRAGSGDARSLLDDFEVPQSDLIGHEKS
jgi:hypothetical protein